MGNCYSKNSNKVRAGTPAKGWTQMQKQEEEFNKNGKIDTEYVLPEKRPLKESDNSFEETSEFEKLGTVTKKTLRSSSADCVPEHFNPVTAGCSAVHSDNGTENTSNIQESLRESQLERDELAKKLERLSRGSCHKCGNFKLDDFTLSALLADTYCLCGPKQLGRPTVNPRCQTHGSERIHRRDASTTSYTNCDPVAENGSVGSRYVKLNVSDKDVDDSLPKSDSKKLNSANKDQSIRKNVRESNVSLSSSEKSRNFGANTFDEDINRNKAPLAQFDSMEANLNDFSIDMNQKRRSLLSEILDITESVCKCNFYSNEHCTNNNGAVDTVRGRCNDISEVCIQGQSHETGKCSSYVTGYPVESSTSRNAENICGFSSDSPQRLSSPNNKSSSLPKNVSFAACEDISHEASVNSSPAKLLPKLGGMNLSHLESVTSESSLGAYTQKTSSDLFLAKRQKDAHKRTASLGSVKVLMSDSSSDAPYCVAEDDVGSLDLDDISRVTSLSYNSIRQLLDSTEDLVHQSNAVQNVTIDGVDCMVIPKEVYYQMQTDLSVLKQQLLCLSLLMRKGSEGMEQNPDF